MKRTLVLHKSEGKGARSGAFCWFVTTVTKEDVEISQRCRRRRDPVMSPEVDTRGKMPLNGLNVIKGPFRAAKMPSSLDKLAYGEISSPHTSPHPPPRRYQRRSDSSARLYLLCSVWSECEAPHIATDEGLRIINQPGRANISREGRVGAGGEAGEGASRLICKVNAAAAYFCRHGL